MPSRRELIQLSADEVLAFLKKKAKSEIPAPKGPGEKKDEGRVTKDEGKNKKDEGKKE